MPVQRRSGAPLLPISLVTPAFKGLNKQAETSILGPEWATVADNCVFDDAGRLAARKGWSGVTSASIGGAIRIHQIHEQVFSDGTVEIISAANSKLYKGTTTLTDITGAATVTVDNEWQFVNFVGSVYGFQQGEQPIGRTSGNFVDMTATSGTWPTGNCAVAHSGRIWAAEGKQTIKYCALLDVAHWLTGAGSIDMTSVWPAGMDEIVALAYYNNRMVVFGKNQIVFFSDGVGSPLGIDPANIQVVDTIVGTGCIARDTVQQIEGGDMLFLSAQGVQSLGRLIQNESNPIDNVSKNVRDYLKQQVSLCNKTKIKSVYSPENGFYLLSLAEAGTSFCLNTLGRMEDGTFRITTWSHMLPYGMVRARDGTLYLSLYDTAGGKIGSYSGQQDNGTAYLFDYTSAWLDLGEEAASYLKILKTITGIFYISQSADLFIKWDTDFQGDFSSVPLHLVSPGTSEWGIMEWGLGEWSGGLALRNVNTPISGNGQYIRVGVYSSINGSSLAVQQLNLFTKIGRMARASNL